ncbi:MAG: L,D-transpeptidase family protein [Pseudonocardiales bacterium]|nr:L,D-transpeptidase family protein [Pseudonocardiales bacterium]MBV9029030.1 L,D-transpeptidase family protein [Pseudonocardiales bacterium]MBW0011259.1 L,D-transpeptidase family protein [Pseudonocardiales bacterium]
MRRVLMLVVVASVLAACSGGSPGPSGGSAPPRPQAQVSTLPADKATNVSPTLPVSVRVTKGVLQQVVLTNPDGRAVAGTLSADRSSWVSAEPLGYGKTYTWSGSAAGADHLSVPVAGSFTTVSPLRQLHATLNIGDGDTVGIAAPIILQFDDHVSDKAAVERALQVQASVPTVGSWAWLPDDNGGSRAHYRPKDYWQPDTHVTVTAKLYGVALGGGSYGMEDISTKFTIGRAQIVRADVDSHRMIVIRDGQEVMNFPASYGLSSDPNRNTTSGIHVVMNKAQTVLMSNRAYGYVNIPEHWAVRISNNGEFIHANPETTGVQGSANVTHGCVNLSTANAQEYYSSAIFGDPVEVTGSPTPLTGADGDIYDWTVPWDAWLAMSALHS